jgi:hypothetical protein
VVNARLVRAPFPASAVLAGLVILLSSASAWACPSCTTRSGGGSIIPILLGAMILTPYIVSTVVLRIIRKAEAERAIEESAATVTATDRKQSHGSGAGGTAPARA